VEHVGVARDEAAEIDVGVGQLLGRDVDDSRLGDPSAGRCEQRHPMTEHGEPAHERHDHALRAAVPAHGQPVMRGDDDVQACHTAPRSSTRW